jgi:hypothetical protein
MELPSTQPKQPKKQPKAPSLKDILRSLRLITGFIYKPFQTEPKQAAKVLLPSSFPLKPHLFNYFSLFFTYELF